MRRQKKNTPNARPVDAVSRVHQDAPTVEVEQTHDAAVHVPAVAGGKTVDIAFSSHMGTRETQQDALYVTPEMLPGSICYAVLCDGMGGMVDGDKAAFEAVAAVAERLASLPPQADVPAVLLSAAREANDRVLALGINGTGTTLVIAVVVCDMLYWLSVGDSRLYIQRGGEMVQATRDHNYGMRLKEMAERGELSIEEAEEAPHREALISFIGIPTLELCDLSLRPFRLLPGDIVLLCTDGLTNSLSDRIIQSILRAPTSLSQRAERLPLAALDAAVAGQDNTSVILMQYRGRDD